MPTNRRLAILLVIVASLNVPLPGTAWAQINLQPDSVRGQQAIVDAINQDYLAKRAESQRAGSNLPGDELGPDASDSHFPKGPSNLATDSVTVKAYQEALRAYYAYFKRGLEHRSRLFQWQYVSSIVTFVVVLILVFAGIYFAAVQFHAGMEQNAKRGADSESERTEIVANFKEIKISSPVLGVIVLIISLMFFYLYLVYVYPISEIF